MTAINKKFMTGRSSARRNAQGLIDIYFTRYNRTRLLPDKFSPKIIKSSIMHGNPDGSEMQTGGLTTYWKFTPQEGNPNGGYWTQATDQTGETEMHSFDHDYDI